MTQPASPPPLPNPKLSKRALSLFFRVGCERQLALHLYSDAGRRLLGMPPRQGGRAGLGLVGAHGYEHQAAKVEELKGAFGATLVRVGAPHGSQGQTEPVDLLSVLTASIVVPYTIVVEAEFAGSTTVARRELGLDHLQDRNGSPVEISLLRPDIVQILPPLAVHLIDDPTLERAYREEVLPTGNTRTIDPAGDARLRLRVADVKLSSEPGAHYFAETVFYSMVLAAWLEENQLHEQFAVVAAPAVVPGSLEVSALLAALAAANARGLPLTPAAAAAAWRGDLEIAPVEAFAPRILQFVQVTLPRVLSTAWQQLSFHVDYRCAGCEFLGDPHIRSNGVPTQDPLHCWPEAERADHLSRVAGLTRGAAQVLRAAQVADTSQLAAIQTAGPRHLAFQIHHGLRARRTVFPARAQSLQQQLAAVIPSSGGDALMPRWPDLHIYLFLDYDPATAFTATLGCRAFWREPLPYQSALTAATYKWGRSQGDTEVFPVDQPNVASERREFLRFLAHIRSILTRVQSLDAADNSAGRRDRKTRESTYQIYLWDEAQRKHFVRLVSRHLGAILNDTNLRHLAWLFPPPELLGVAETSTRQTPYTLVSDVVQNTFAIPAAHHYTLMDVVHHLHPAAISAPSVHPLFVDTLSNLIPPERIHEVWRHSPHWQQNQSLLIETTTKKLSALGMVVGELERSLSAVLSRSSAPRLPRPGNRPPGIAAEGYLWIEYARLNAALSSLEVDRVRAMPAHEREARFRSARLTRRLSGAAEAAAWALLRLGAANLPARGGRLMIFELDADSRQINARPGDFNFALSPAHEHGFLDRHPYPIISNTPITVYGSTVAESKMTAVSIAAIDRTHGFIALEQDARSKFDELARHLPQLDFANDVMMDPVYADYLTGKIERTLRGIGNPPCAVPPPRVAAALGLPPRFAAGRSRMTPAAEVLWQASQLEAKSTGRVVPPLRQALEAHFSGKGRVLLPDQWAAWERALGNQLTLIWGPPGTGKSHTLRAIVMGAVLDAIRERKKIRILVSANTYTAVDNILLKLQGDLSDLPGVRAGRARPYKIFRVQSESRQPDHDFVRDYPDIKNIELHRTNPSAAAVRLVKQLGHPNAIIVVGAPSQQLHNLAIAGVTSTAASHTQKPWFDLTVIDEASQMDVGTSALVLSKRAPSGGCVFAGDDLQLPPIHAAEPPLGLENSVGSVYNFLRHERGATPSALNVSFRSNDTLIEFTREAGYDPTLRAHSGALSLSLGVIPVQRPPAWPVNLPWSEQYAEILAPAHPAVCLLHDDVMSAQSNEFEAGHVAAMATLLRTHLHDGLLGEIDAFGNPIPYLPPTEYRADRFWSHGLGIVVPHRAQMSLVASGLITAFPRDSADAIRSAVDTVERFQGQERDVIIASFGLGDPDVITAEEEFLYSLRRFNVMASRARAKLIVMVSRSVIEHLSDNSEVLAESLLLKRFAEQFCTRVSPQLPTDLWEFRRR